MGRKIADHIKGFDHYAIFVEDLEASVHFYERVMGFAQKVRPALSFPGAWFDLGHGQELHLIAGEGTPNSGSRKLHFAFEVDDFESILELCLSNNIPHEKPKRRPDGPYQLFIRDNSGYYIEFTLKTYY